MKSSRHDLPEVNAGSMADIAFLLLIFFLVTTTMSVDEGINRKLPKECPPNVDCSVIIPERNIFRIVLNNNDEILVEDEPISLEELKDITKAFLDNNGNKSCSYCNGSSVSFLSDSPKKAVVSLQNDRQTSYKFYIAVQDELTKAYYELRTVYANKVLKKETDALTKAELKELKDAYPFVLSEAQTKQ